LAWSCWSAGHWDRWRGTELFLNCLGGAVFFDYEHELAFRATDFNSLGSDFIVGYLEFCLALGTFDNHLIFLIFPFDNPS
jgi:hypothetical protein